MEEFVTQFITDNPVVIGILVIAGAFMKFCNTVAKFIPSQSSKAWVRIAYKVVAFLGAHAQDVAKYIPGDGKVTVAEVQAAEVAKEVTKEVVARKK